MQRTDDTLVGIVVALCLHGLVVLLFVLSNLFSVAANQPEAKGEPVLASAMISTADIRRAESTIRESEAALPAKAAPTFQPKPEPAPQMAETPQQVQEQAPQVQPDTVDQEPINKLAIEETEEEIIAEREARRRQAQVNLTDHIQKQQMAENEQRLREQQLAELEVISLAKNSVDNVTRMENQRLQQVEDMQSTETVHDSPGPEQTASGNPNATSDNLEARYMAAIKATIQSNWHHNGAQPLERCQVEFTQAPGGEVIDVTFLSCSFSPEGRASAERAVRLTPLPYYGFEPVFKRQQKFTLCYPTEQCGG